MFIVKRKRVQAKVERFGFDQQQRAVAARFGVDQRKLPHRQARSAGPVEIMQNFFELRASHRHRLFAHGATAEARLTGRGSCNGSRSFSSSRARARCNRERTVPTGHVSAEAASS